MASPAGPPEWRKYFYPGTEVLRNKLDIRDPDELQRLEYDVTEQQAAALRNGDLPIEGDTAGERLSFIHEALLGNIYEWAGEHRDVNISKSGQSFGDHASMGMYMRQLTGAINRFDWDAASYDQAVDKLAEIHTDLNFSHPYREGNGRSSRIFMTDLAAQHGIDLDFTLVDNTRWNEASAATFLDPAGLRLDPAPLAEIYHEIATPQSPASPDTSETAEGIDLGAAAELDYSAIVASCIEDPYDFGDSYDTNTVDGNATPASNSPDHAEQAPSAPQRDEGYGAEY
ncbi:MAG: Fic/DOC family protein [Micrococcaceae bacterium]